MEDTTRAGYDSWIDNTVVDSAGDKVGKVTHIFYDDQTHRPEWLAIKTGMFGSNDTFVPIQGSTLDSAGQIQVAFDKDYIKEAPNIDTEDLHMTPEDERRLWQYYGFDYADTKAVNHGYGKDYRTGRRADKDFAHSRWDRQRQDWGEERVDHDEVVAEATVMSEQAVKEQVPETVRLRKYRRTEMVPVTKEEVRVEKGDVETGRAGTGRVESAEGFSGRAGAPADIETEQRRQRSTR